MSEIYQQCNIVEVRPPSSKVQDLELPLTEDDKKLRMIRDFVVGLNRKHSVETLTKSLRKLQDASRLQTIDKNALVHLLLEIRRHKDKIEILTGEML